MKRSGWAGLAVVAPVVFFSACELPFTFVTACSSSDDCDVGKVCVGGECTAPVCDDPGLQRSCICPDSSMGTQACNADRTGLTPCSCGGGSSSSSTGGASTSSSSGGGASSSGVTQSSSRAGSSSGTLNSSSGNSAGSSSVGGTSSNSGASSDVNSSSVDASSSVDGSSSVDVGSSSSSSSSSGMVTLTFNVLGSKAALVTHVYVENADGDLITEPCSNSACTVTRAQGSVARALASFTDKAGATVSHWDQTVAPEDCAFNSNFCAVHFTPGNVVNVNVASVNYIFVLDDQSVMLPFGLGNADAACRNAASNAGLPAQNYMALIGFGSRGPMTLLGSGINNLARPDGRPVVMQGTSLGFNTIDSLFPPILNANAARVGSVLISTGTLPDGSVDTTNNCNDWLGGMGYNHATGRAEFLDRMWSETTYNDNCMLGMAVQFLCTGTQTGLDGFFPNSRAPQGLQVFVSQGMFSPNTGIGAADAICQQDATNAGLTGTFRALLNTSTENALSHVGYVPGRIYSTPNGLHPFDFPNFGLVSPIALTAAGSRPVEPFVITGGVPDSVSAASNTCSDWTDMGGTMQLGYSTSVELAFATRDTVNCGMAHPVYCVQAP